MSKKLLPVITLALSLAVLGPAQVRLVNAQDEEAGQGQERAPGQGSRAPGQGRIPGAQGDLGAGVDQEGQQPGQLEEIRTVDIGEAVPDFSLKAIDGSEHSLSAHRGQVVVLEFIGPDDPFMAKHHVTNTTIPDMVEDYRESGVTWFAVASGKAAEPDLLRGQLGAWRIDYPVLLDRDKKLARILGARTTTQVFVIDAEGVLAYSGAIDDDKSQDEVGGTNFLKDALDAVLEGELLETPRTDPYGTPIE